MPVRGLRGAIDVSQDQAEEVLAATQELLEAILLANPALNPADVASVLFTVTEDLQSVYPAQAARLMGWRNVPLMCAREIPVPGKLPRCIRDSAPLEHRPGAGAGSARVSAAAPKTCAPIGSKQSRPESRRRKPLKIKRSVGCLRNATELTPKDPRRDGLVQWLFLNKKLNQWKSTRATAEVLYSLVHYLKAEGALGGRETMKVIVGGRETAFTFEPDKYTGKKNQVVIPGPQVDPRRPRRSPSRRGARASPSPPPPGTSRPRSSPRKTAATSSTSRGGTSSARTPGRNGCSSPSPTAPR